MTLFLVSSKLLRERSNATLKNQGILLGARRKEEEMQVGVCKPARQWLLGAPKPPI